MERLELKTGLHEWPRIATAGRCHSKAIVAQSEHGWNPQMVVLAPDVEEVGGQLGAPLPAPRGLRDVA